MNTVVARTCSPVQFGLGEHPETGESQSLTVFRDKPAYVLLGDPGTGKTTAFEQECLDLGSEAHFVTARDFLTFDVDLHPEWTGKMLFIDGLDEVRAGTSDARHSLDGIRQRLDRLGKPVFRLSCRAADWLGTNDLANLSSVVRDGIEPTVLLLDSLNDADVEKILRSFPYVDEPQAFIAAARERGMEDILRNPQTLELMARAVAKDGTWPKDRMDTFEMACLQMAAETNEEHLLAGRPPSTENVLTAAGRICSILLFSGNSGCTLHDSGAQDGYLPLDSFGEDRKGSFRFALATRLFKSVGPERFVPIHRHIAEFLGARYLSRTIDDGLPYGRVTALMTGYEGRVVSELRGLSAWLAALSGPARNDLIARDPTGVGLYGDIRHFRASEKMDLLDALAGEGTRLGGGDRLARAFSSLSVPDLEEQFKELLKEPGDSADRITFVLFVLRVLSHGTPLPGLKEPLFELVRNDSLPSAVRAAALRAFIRSCIDHEEKSARLKALLEDVQSNAVPDHDDQILGVLLFALYPDELPPDRVLDLLREPRLPNFFGTYFLFWSRGLVSQSTSDQVAPLLDSLSERLPQLSALSRRHLLEMPFLNLLARGLEETEEEISGERLYTWLGIGAGRLAGYHSSAEQEVAVGRIRRWLELRPEAQKSLILAGLSNCASSQYVEPCASQVFNRLNGVKPPDDFGLWCLEQATSWSNSASHIAEALLEKAVSEYRSQRHGEGHLSVDTFRNRCWNNSLLEQRLDLLLNPPTPALRHQSEAGTARYTDELNNEKWQWLEYVDEQRNQLLNNQAPPLLLFQLARYYFGNFFVELDQGNGAPRLDELLEDSGLVQAALQGIRGSVHREDLPRAEEVIKLRAQDRMHYLVLPYLAGLQEMQGTEQGDVSGWDSDRLRKAVIYYYSSAHLDYNPWWYGQLLEHNPEAVANLQVEFAVPEFKHGAEYVSKIDRLADDPAHFQVAELAALRLLSRFPRRCKNGQLRVLNSLLWAAILHADRESLLELVREKLLLKGMNPAQRASWLTAALVLSSEEYIAQFESFTSGSANRISYVADFFPDRMNFEPDIAATEVLIRTIGARSTPTRLDGFATRVIHSSDLASDLISRLGGLPYREATEAFERLAGDPSLLRWHGHLKDTLDRQSILRRDTEFSHATPEEVSQVLSSGVPANASDLWALLNDVLHDLSKSIRTGNTDDWRQYWNEVAGGNPTPKHEDHCRDALLSDLRRVLPGPVDVQPEGQYANDKRADMRAAFGDFQVPVEIKKNSHPKIWSAIDDQLIAKYTSASETRGHGIYLVFWFGEAYTKVAPPSGRRPKSPDQLKQQLEKLIEGEKSLKISVCVVDVSRPTQ